jgi:hypothetical protein
MTVYFRSSASRTCLSWPFFVYETMISLRKKTKRNKRERNTAGEKKTQCEY